MGVIGRTITLALSTDNFVASDEDLGKIKSVDPSFPIDLADDTNNDSNGSKENEYADASATLSATFSYDPTDAGQAILIAEAFTNKAGIYVRYRPQGDGTGPEWIFACKISDLSIPASTSEVIDSSVTLESDGAITYNATQ